MITHNCIQGTPEWAGLRAGIPTASAFDRILTPGGKASKSAESYMFSLLAERIMGHPIVEFTSHWMDRGTQMEKDAVSFYELQRDCETVKVGFITSDDGTVGASPDRLVGDDGLLEIKVPAEHTHVGYLLESGSAYEAYRIQVQGQLWISERNWCDVLSFHPEMPPALTRIHRDDGCIEILAKAVTAFSRVLEEQFKLCVERGWINKPEPQPREMTAAQAMKEALRRSQ